MVVSGLCECRQKGDEVWVDLPIEPHQSINLVLEVYSNLLPQFLDSEEATGNIDLDIGLDDAAEQL